MSEQFLDNFTRALSSGATWLQAAKKRLLSKDAHSMHAKGLPSALASQVSFWSGTILYSSQSVEVRLMLQDNGGALSGRLQAVDLVNSQLLEMGDATGTKSGDEINLRTTTDLVIAATLTADALVGKITFPSMNGDPGFEADVSFASIPAYMTYLPLVTR